MIAILIRGSSSAARFNGITTGQLHLGGRDKDGSNWWVFTDRHITAHHEVDTCETHHAGRVRCCRGTG